MKKSISLLCLLAVLVTMLGASLVSVSAANATSGKYDQLTWSLNTATGTLTLSGQGAMNDTLAYDDMPWDVHKDAIVSVVVEEGVTTVCYSAFSGLKKLTSVTLPTTLNAIDANAFRGCSALESIVIPHAVRGIGDSAFAECTSLSDITLPKAIPSIKSDAFDGTPLYTDESNWKDGMLMVKGHLIVGKPELSGDITLPEGTLTVAADAFRDNTALTGITVPDSVLAIGFQAFGGCDGLTSLSLPFVGAERAARTNSDFGYIFGASTTTADKTPYIPAGLKRVVITSAEHIHMKDFANYSMLTEIVLPRTLRTIDSEAFLNCTGLTEITLPEGLTSIGNGAFRGCTKLASITLPDSLTDIAYDCFDDTAYYKNADNWDGNILYMGRHLVAAKTTLAGKVDIKTGTKTVANGALRNCTQITSVSIPASVTHISADSFYGCTALADISMPTTVEFVGRRILKNTAYEQNAANWTDGLLYAGNYLLAAKEDLTGTVTVRNGTLLIADSVFESSDMRAVKLPDTLVVIGDSAFFQCEELTEVVIPDTVRVIGNAAFFYCRKLATVTMPDGGLYIGASAFKMTALYQDDANWTEGMLYVGNHLVDVKTEAAMGSVTVREGTVSLADRAFVNCLYMTEVILPDTVKNIHPDAFAYCVLLENVPTLNNGTSSGSTAGGGTDETPDAQEPGHDAENEKGGDISDTSDTEEGCGSSLAWPVLIMLAAALPVCMTRKKED